MALNIEEKRNFPRLRSRIPLRYQIRGTPEFADTVSDDISTGGISFIDKKFVTPKALVMLEMNLLSRILKSAGRVAWASPLPHSDRYRLGIEFLELDPRERTYLSDFIDMQMGKI